MVQLVNPSIFNASKAAKNARILPGPVPSSFAKLGWLRCISRKSSNLGEWIYIIHLYGYIYIYVYIICINIHKYQLTFINHCFHCYKYQTSCTYIHIYILLLLIIIIIIYISINYRSINRVI